ncbi:hypothetical protein [uncultured Acinetobacter sp.]|uniref:hypothetical protein n=1 Tax=uncultured Acinetobacter sp. TaxID=165433 RepID=UPI002583C90B|nr:hypothetical protein [uncultured Acinetobacter sp.]
MEHKAYIDNHIPSSLPFGGVMLGTMLVATVIVFGGHTLAVKIAKDRESNNIPAAAQQTIVTQNYYQVASAKLTSDITGEALISMSEFIVPIKFVYDTSTKFNEKVIDIRRLDIGVITDVSGKHQYRDFTNDLDHQGINTALVSYIKKHKLMEGI